MFYTFLEKLEEKKAEIIKKKREGNVFEYV